MQNGEQVEQEKQEVVTQVDLHISEKHDKDEGQNDDEIGDERGGRKVGE